MAGLSRRRSAAHPKNRERKDLARRPTAGPLGSPGRRSLSLSLLGPSRPPPASLRPLLRFPFPPLAPSFLSAAVPATPTPFSALSSRLPGLSRCLSSPLLHTLPFGPLCSFPAPGPPAGLFSPFFLSLLSPQRPRLALWPSEWLPCFPPWVPVRPCHLVLPRYLCLSASPSECLSVCLGEVPPTPAARHLPQGTLVVLGHL